LIVGEDQVLSQTRALLLHDWEVSTTHPIHAPEVIRAHAYDLLIFCQSVQDSRAEQLLAEAVYLYPLTKCLAISDDEGRGKQFSASTYLSRLSNPGGLREAVASLLERR
jgi:hypothetical protein